MHRNKDRCISTARSSCLKGVIVVALLAAPALANDAWPDREICRAAMKTYFWLNELPVDADDNGEFMGFRSESHYFYTCKIDGNIAEFKWINGSAENMSSRSTMFEISGNSLTVKSDLGTDIYRR